MDTAKIVMGWIQFGGKWIQLVVVGHNMTLGGSKDGPRFIRVDVQNRGNEG